MNDPTMSAPSFWIRRSQFGRHGEGEGGCLIEDTNDSWIRLDDRDNPPSGRLMCWGCNDLTTVVMHDPRKAEAECVECGRTYKVEVGS